MNKNPGLIVVLTVAIVVALASAGAFAVNLQQNNTPSTPPNQRSSTSSESNSISSAPSTSTQSSVTSSQQASKGSYTDYSSAKLAEATGKKKVIFFHAAWCSSCRSQDANLKQQADNIPGNVLILKADFDREIALRQKYGVTLQHTFVEVDDNGNELQQWSALYQDGELAAILERIS